MNNISTLLTNHVNNQRYLKHVQAMFHNLFHSEEDFRLVVETSVNVTSNIPSQDYTHL